MLKKCDFKIGKFHCRVLALTPKTEHLCVGAYATAEIVGAHLAMYWVSVGLAISVAGSFVYEKMVAANA